MTCGASRVDVRASPVRASQPMTLRAVRRNRPRTWQQKTRSSRAMRSGCPFERFLFRAAGLSVARPPPHPAAPADPLIRMPPHPGSLGRLPGRGPPKALYISMTSISTFSLVTIFTNTSAMNSLGDEAA